MSELYSIKKETLTGIADALRGKFGETEIVIVQEEVPIPFKKISKTLNTTGFDTHEGGYGDNQKIYDVVTMDGASSIKVKMAYQGEKGSKIYDYVQVAAGSLSSMPSDAPKYGSEKIEYVELTFENTDTVTFYFESDVNGSANFGYYAEIIGYDADGNVLGDEYEIIEVEKEIPITYTTAEMTQGIRKLLSTPPKWAYELTGDCTKRFQDDLWKWLFESIGNEMTTKDITKLEEMFRYAPFESIPFDINMNNSTAQECRYIYGDCNNLKQVGKLVGLNPRRLTGTFARCYNLRSVPEFEDMDTTTLHTSNGWLGYMFEYCYSLREIPDCWLKLKCGYGSGYYTPYGNTFSDCCSLDEIVGLVVVDDVEYVSNVFGSYRTFINTHRLKRITFETNEDGSPKTAQWKGQSIDLTGSVGYVPYDSYKNKVLDYNSGITADKEVKDDATYQALKDDPDWFTCDVAYSRYNKDSAIATINSLPDTSAYLATQSGASNSIKFRGEAGSKTDGGAIQDLDAETLALASSRGWTCAFV